MSAVGDGASEITEIDLRACTVRIDVAGAPKGTGFFVAPSHVVTCEHVLGGATEGIRLSDLDGVEYSVVKVADISEEDDLAVLRVRQADASDDDHLAVNGKPAAEHPCALLIGGQRFNDEFITFGYPERHREGIASPLKAEGHTGDERLLKLGQGQVQPGMSGAPLLNTRTRGVCGVLSLTRNEQMALGGYAVPIERLFLLSPTLKRQNEGYHMARRHDWFDRLPPMEKRAILEGRSGAPSTSGFTTWFVVSVGGEQRQWRVSATLYPRGEQLPAEPAEVHLVVAQVARLFRDWAARAAPGGGALVGTSVERAGAVRRRFNEGEEIRLLGSILFDAVLPDVIGQRFDELLSAEGERVQLALHFDRTVIPPEFVDMPWEYLSLADERGFRRDVWVAGDETLAFVRVKQSDFHEPEPPTSRQLSALVVAVTPPSESGGYGPDDVSDDVCRVIKRRLGEVGAEPLPLPRAMDLRDKLAAGAYDILHYVGFGRYHEGADQLALGGAPYDYREAQMFAALLPDGEQRPRVVVLQQIDGPKESVPRTSLCSLGDSSSAAWKQSSHTSSHSRRGSVRSSMMSFTPSSRRVSASRSLCRRHGRSSLRWIPTCIRSAPRLRS